MMRTVVEPQVRSPPLPSLIGQQGEGERAGRAEQLRPQELGNMSAHHTLARTLAQGLVDRPRRVDDAKVPVEADERPAECGEGRAHTLPGGVGLDIRRVFAVHRCG